MHELYELKEKLMNTLEDYSKKDMTANNLEVVDKLTHTIKNLCKIIEDAEESEYSEMGGSYARGGRYSRERMGGRYSRYGMAYADGRGRGTQANRDSMGRYSSDDGIINELREMAHDAPDSKTRMDIENLIRKMENR